MTWPGFLSVVPPFSPDTLLHHVRLLGLCDPFLTSCHFHPLPIPSQTLCLTPVQDFPALPPEFRLRLLLGIFILLLYSLNSTYVLPEYALWTKFLWLAHHLLRCQVLQVVPLPLACALSWDQASACLSSLSMLVSVAEAWDHPGQCQHGFPKDKLLYKIKRVKEEF